MRGDQMRPTEVWVYSVIKAVVNKGQDRLKALMLSSVENDLLLDHDDLNLVDITLFAAIGYSRKMLLLDDT